MSFPHLTATVMTLVLVASTKIYQVTAQANPQSTQIAEAFVNNLERKNTAGLEQLLAPDAIFEAFDALSPKNLAALVLRVLDLEDRSIKQRLPNFLRVRPRDTRVQGRKATLEQLSTALESFDQLDFGNERIGTGQDNRTVLVEAQGRYTLRQTGVTVQNSFALVLQLNRNNQISSIQAQITPFVRVRESNASTQIH